VKYLPTLLIFSTLCFIGAYGIQKRRWWVWYAGWLAALVFLGAICAVIWRVAGSVETSVNMAGFALFTVGAPLVWVSWVMWWYCHRKEFGISLKKQT
jgi:hypothetical protein